LRVATKDDGTGGVVAFAASFIGAAFDRFSTTAPIGTKDKVLGGQAVVSLAINADNSFAIGQQVIGQTSNTFAVSHFDSNGKATGSLTPLNIAAAPAGANEIDVTVTLLKDGSYAAGFLQTMGNQTAAYAQHLDSNGVADTAGSVQINTA